MSGLTEAGMGIKGIVATAAALALLLQEGIGDTIRASLTPRPGEPRTNEVVACQEVLQALGLRSFTPQVAGLPGLRPDHEHLFQELAGQHPDAGCASRCRSGRARYPGVES